MNVLWLEMFILHFFIGGIVCLYQFTKFEKVQVHEKNCI